MKTVARNQVNYKAALAVAIGLLVLSLIPLYALGMNAHPCADDYLYGVKTGEVWRETHSFVAVLKEAWSVTRESYNTWQGNSAALFLMCLIPFWVSELVRTFGWMILLRKEKSARLL